MGPRFAWDDGAGHARPEVAFASRACLRDGPKRIPARVLIDIVLLIHVAETRLWASYVEKTSGMPVKHRLPA
jgi:hypothetical protein